MIGLRLMLLGGFEARLASGAAVSLPTKKGQALLAYLGARSGQSQSRDKLAALLWGGKSDERARGDLRHALVTLRRALAGADPPVLRIESQTLALNADGVEVDVMTFERRVAEGTVPALEQAVELYRGDLLLGFNVKESLFEEWLVTERERLREMAMEALSKLLAHQTKARATERAIQTAVRLLGLDPLQEAVHRTLMRLYSRQGRRGAALKQYQTCVGVLQRELGTAPESETKQLYQELLRRPVGAPETAGVHGDHRSQATTPPVGGAPPDLPAAETPLFGRQMEMERLRQLLDEAIRGQGHAAVVVGEAGIGKTRLVSTLAADALAQGCRVLIGHCHESDSILPFGPWVEACRTGAISADEEILNALHPRWRIELTRLLPEAGQAGLAVTSDSALPLFESVASLMEQVAARQPLVLVLEDLHWADEMSLRLLSFVSRRIPAWRALLVATGREEELPDASIARRTVEELARAPRATTVALSPLSRDDTVLLVRALARVGHPTAAIAKVEERIWTLSEGNPFVTLEVMRAVGQDGLSAEEPSLALPARVRDLVAGRLHRLGARTQQVAAVAAVIGRRCDFTLLRAASGVDEHHAAEAVEEMVRERVLQTVGDQLDFTHDRVREVAYGRLLPQRRRLLHRAVFEALEAMGREIPAAQSRARLDEHVEQLAHHALHGELWEQAVRYLRHAGGKAAARSALHDARAWFEQALGTLRRLPETRETTELIIDIHIDLWNALIPLDDRGRIGEHLQKAEGLARTLGDQHRLGRIATLMVVQCLVTGDYDEAVRSGQEALSITCTLGDRSIEVVATTVLGRTHLARGEFSAAAAFLERNVALEGDLRYERFGTPAIQSAISGACLADVLSELGRFDEAIGHAEGAVRIAEAADHPFTLHTGLFDLGRAHLHRGDLPRATGALERCLDLCRTWQIVVWTPLVAAALGAAYALAGRADEALPLVAGAVEEFRSRQTHIRPALILLCAGRTYLSAGRIEEAASQAREALALTRRLGARGSEAHALCLTGDVASTGVGEDAAGYYLEALALAAELGMRPLVAHCHFGLGNVSWRTGQFDEAREHLITATAMYREMDMRFWLELAEARMRELARG